MYGQADLSGGYGQKPAMPAAGYSPASSTSGQYPAYNPNPNVAPPLAGSSSGQYPPYNPNPAPLQAGFMMDPQFQQSRPAYTSSPQVMVMRQMNHDKEPLIAKASGSRVLCLTVYGLLAFGIIVGFLMAVIFGTTWKQTWGYGYPN